MTALPLPIQRARGYIDVARSDSLVRNSLYMMTTTVVTAGLGYVFWIVAARIFSSAQIGIASAVISLCTTLALLTYLGSFSMLVKCLHAYERSRLWTSIVVRVCVLTSALTAIVAAIAVPFFADSKSYGSFFHSTWAILLAVAGAATWTLVNLFSAVFIAARRAGSVLSTQALVSVAKVLLVVPVAALGLGAVGIVGAWGISGLIGVVIGSLWFVPRLGLGGAKQFEPSHRAVGLTDQGKTRFGGSYWLSYWKARHRRSLRLNASTFGQLIGQHLTGVGGAVTPLILPVLVALRLGVVSNAYFYVTWMIGGIFFTVSPSVSSALFAETVRVTSDLRGVVLKAFRVTSLILIPLMVVVIAGGRLILAVFGRQYAAAGYGLLVILALSAMPDAVSNIAVAVFRAKNRLRYAVMINIGILIATVVGAWFLMPLLGIVGAGVAWLLAQVLAAIASIPAYINFPVRE
jgi:O-antigen/teichoic acid export membrane protein